MKMLRKTVDVSLLGDSLSELLTDIKNQVEVTLTCDGMPLAKVLPLSPEEKVTINEKGLPSRIPGGWKGLGR